MMNFFKSRRKSIDEFNEDLTILDPPVFNEIPYLQAPQPPQPRPLSFKLQEFNQINQQNANQFSKNARVTAKASEYDIVSPTESEFSDKNMNLVSIGIRGEQERNMVLEQQIKLLSQQAALALDRLSEVSKENDRLKTENEGLKKSKSHLSFGRRQSSVVSNSSTSSGSIFSKNSMSQTSSMSSITTQLSMKNQLDEINSSHEKEVNTLKMELNNLQSQLKENGNIIKEMKQNLHMLRVQSQSVQDQLQKEYIQNKSLAQKLFKMKKQQTIEMEYYKVQIKELVNQLSMRQEQDLNLRQRLMRYDETLMTINTSTKMLS